MSLKIILILLALSGVGGVSLGYVLRGLIGLAQGGSVEVEIKQKLLQAKEQAAKIIAEAQFRGEVVETERLAPIEEREEKIDAKEERIAARKAPTFQKRRRARSYFQRLSVRMKRQFSCACRSSPPTAASA